MLESLLSLFGFGAGVAVAVELSKSLVERGM
jgi:hypothetical protein